MSASDETMNCEEYREAIAADPRASSEDVTRHAAECEACTAYTADMRAFDTRIARALEIRVPELKIPDLPPIDGDKVTGLPINEPYRLGTQKSNKSEFITQNGLFVFGVNIIQIG